MGHKIIITLLKNRKREKRQSRVAVQRVTRSHRRLPGELRHSIHAITYINN